MVMTYEETIKKLTSSRMFRIRPELNRIADIMDLFGNPQNNLKYIHVAGTNGKGSVCAIISSILCEQGYKVGLYTSPHIFDYTERIKICGKDISKQDFTEYFQEVNETALQNNINLTEFEMLTAIMFLYFQRNSVKYVVLETGMGGRFDATNIIKENICSIITKIDLDHTDRLGTTLEQIAFEKAGIIKQNCPLVTSMKYQAITDTVRKLSSAIFNPPAKIEKIYTNYLALKGLHQEENLKLALCTINQFFPEIANEKILNGLKKVSHPFRFQYFEDKKLIIDASHNPNGIEALRKNLDLFYPNEKRRFVFGCLKRKNYKKMIEILFKKDDEIYFNEFDYPDSCTYDELAKNCPYKALKFSSDTKLSTDKLNIICGSFYMLNKIDFISEYFTNNR
ncbi:MAG: bifunctional folylpolyglutamate synthase/dihydrofolate synthase [bacterium]|nr:bifunctional folylpolyglutamate synthase/dihydrofolate synthase [bacterium]